MLEATSEKLRIEIPLKMCYLDPEHAQECKRNLRNDLENMDLEDDAG